MHSYPIIYWFRQNFHVMPPTSSAPQCHHSRPFVTPRTASKCCCSRRTACQFSHQDGLFSSNGRETVWRTLGKEPPNVLPKTKSHKNPNSGPLILKRVQTDGQTNIRGTLHKCNLDMNMAATPTVRTMNFNLRGGQVRKWGKIGLNQTLIYIHPSPPPSPQFLYLPLFNSTVTKILLGKKNIAPNQMEQEMLEDLNCDGRMALIKI